MPDTHAVLSPSSSARWLACTPSARLCAEIKDKYVGSHSTVTEFCKLFISYVNSWELEG